MKPYKQIINEAKSVGTIYHFTTWSSLILILKSGYMKGSNKIYNDKIVFFPTFNFSTDKKYYLYSFTRFKKLIRFGKIRLTINGDKLSEKYKIVPIGIGNYSSIENNEEVLITTLDKIQIIKYITSINIPKNIINKIKKNNLVFIKKFCKSNNILLTTFSTNDYIKNK